MFVGDDRNHIHSIYLIWFRSSSKYFLVIFDYMISNCKIDVFHTNPSTFIEDPLVFFLYNTASFVLWSHYNAIILNDNLLIIHLIHRLFNKYFFWSKIKNIFEAIQSHKLISNSWKTNYQKQQNFDLIVKS